MLEHSPHKRLVMYALLSALEMDLRSFISLNTLDSAQFDELFSGINEKLRSRSRRREEPNDDYEQLILLMDLGDIISILQTLGGRLPPDVRDGLKTLTER